MPGLRATFEQAVSKHLSAVARLTATGTVLEADRQPAVDPTVIATETALAQRLSASAVALENEPGWVRIGDAKLHRATFPVYVPFLGAAHLRLSQDATDPRVAGLLRSVILQALASHPAGKLRVLTVDTESVGAVFAPLRPLVDAGVATAAATDSSSFEAVLREAEKHVKAGLMGEAGGTMLLAVASVPPLNPPTFARLAALARSGPSAGLFIVAAGVDELPEAVNVVVDGDMRVGNPPRTPFGTRDGLAAPVAFPAVQGNDYLVAESHRLGDRARAAAELAFADLIPQELWESDPSDGLATIAGRDANGNVALRFDDATPHWLIGGRTGGGKTVFLLDVLYGLASRYAPADLSLYLLDFKEGVSFTEFTPQESDPTYIPHARVVGVESDREYGAAILRELDAEMTRRSVVMKRYGVARYAELRAHRRLPRIVCFIDEFQVLFAGNDKLAQEAASLLENLARKGRSYGVHLVLASQTTSGIEALYSKRDSIFGQFGLRVALPGATSVLDAQNTAAQGLRLGEAVVNTDGGMAGGDRKIRFPNAHGDPTTLRWLRDDMYRRRGDLPPPSVFYGYKPVHLDENPDYAASTATEHPDVMLGVRIDAALQTAAVRFEPVPGRHLSVVGSDGTGAQVLEAAAASVARQRPGARFLVAGLAETAVVQRTMTLLGGSATLLSDPAAVTSAITELAEGVGPTYLVGFGLDTLALDMTTKKALSTLLRQGPATGTHLLGWWRSLRRFTDDVGGSAGKEDVAYTVVLNVPGAELMGHFGMTATSWQPRPGRALLIDRHANTQELFVPFTEREEF